MPEQPSATVYRRDCPDCGREIMAAATRCGFCWSRLEPLAPGSAGTRVETPRPQVVARPIDETLRRDCPKCGRRIMAAATKCGYCWTKLESLTIGTVARVAGPPRLKEAPDATL